MYWIFFAPFLQLIFLGQLDLIFWLVYRSNRPAAWALLSLKPQLLLLVITKIIANKRNLGEFITAVFLLHLPFLLIRPMWPLEWIEFVSTYQNRLTTILHTTVSGEILSSAWVLPFSVFLLALVFLQKKNLDRILFLANPLLLPYDHSLMMGTVSKIIIPLSWLALWGAWRVQAGWPYALMLLATLVFETYRERRIDSSNARNTPSNLDGNGDGETGITSGK